MQLSIVIPIYKVERYIEKCLESCIHQDVVLGQDYEIICINDGSPDDSAEIAKKIANKYNGVIVIDQANQGLSGARNQGFLKSKGDYVWFVDSDDWIEENCLANLFPLLKDDVDIVEIQYRYVDEYGNITPGEDGCAIDGFLTGKEVTLKGGLHTPVPFTIMRSDFIRLNNLKFIEGIYHEDVEFKIRALLVAKKVVSSPYVCYNYLKRSSGSITSSYKLKNGLDMLFVLNRHYQFVHSYDKAVKKAIYSKISMWMNSVLLGIRQLSGEDYEVLLKELKQNKKLFYAMRHANSIKYMIEGTLLGINVPLGLWVHSKIR